MARSRPSATSLRSRSPRAGETRQEYDVSGMVALLAPYTGIPAHVLIEESQAMPGQGVRSMWTTGYGYGLWLGVLSALQLPHTRIRPHAWKRALARIFHKKGQTSSKSLIE